MAENQPIFNFYYGNGSPLLDQIFEQVRQNGKDIKTLMALTTQEEADLQELLNDAATIATELNDLKTTNAATVADLQVKLQQAGVDRDTAQTLAANLQASLDENSAELDGKLSQLKTSFSALLPAPTVDSGNPDPGTTTGP